MFEMTLTISNLLSPASRRNASIPNDSALFFLLSVFLEFTGYAWLCMRDISSVFLFTKERGRREGKATTKERKANWREESQRELHSFRLHSGTLLLLEPVFPSSRAQMIPRSNFFPFLFFFPPEEICFSQMVLLSYGALFSTPFSSCPSPAGLGCLLSCFAGGGLQSICFFCRFSRLRMEFHFNMGCGWVVAARRILVELILGCCFGLSRGV